MHHSTIFGAAVYMLLSDVSRSFVNCHDYCNASECLCILLVDVCSRIFHSSIFHPCRQLVRKRLEKHQVMFVSYRRTTAMSDGNALTSTTKEAKALQQLIQRSDFVAERSQGAECLPAGSTQPNSSFVRRQQTSTSNTINAPPNT